MTLFIARNSALAELPGNPSLCQVARECNSNGGEKFTSNDHARVSTATSRSRGVIPLVG